MTLLYSLATQLYFLAIRLASLWSSKARHAVAGRSEVFRTLKKVDFSGTWIWMHCASLGEFEQGRPVLEGLKKEFPDYKILLTFFSPSGFEIRKNYPHADCIIYLPFDSVQNARRFLNHTMPSLAIFVKYEFWHFYLAGLQKRKVPTILISALFRPKQIFFQWYGGFFRKMLRRFDKIFVQEAGSVALLESIGFNQAEIAGDTRIDRVVAHARNALPIPEIKAFVGRNPVFIAGSTWPADEKILAPFFENSLPPNWKVILAPHAVDPAHLHQIEKWLGPRIIRFSALKATESQQYRILLIDNIGMLASLYQYGKIAYIGGGFGAGIHNTLEPVAYGLPVIFGPKYQKFVEATALIENGGGFSIHDTEGLKDVFKTLQHTHAHQAAAQSALAFVQQNKGASQKILQWCDTLFKNFSGHPQK